MDKLLEGQMFEEIDGYSKWEKVKKVDKGWSDDIKYYIETEDNKKLLLRISNIDTYEQKKKEYDIVCKYSKLGFEMSQPISFGMCNEKWNVYMLLTWVEGEELELALPKLNEDEQYKLGRAAGTILRKIHSLEVPISELPLESKIPKKKMQIQRYVDSEVRISNDEIVLDFINSNINKIGSKKPVYQHGDFHPGNLILTPEGKIGVIDFNRWEIGDPYEEFCKLESFGTEVSIPYCMGQIEEYFNDDVPNDFWDILAVYVAHASLYSIKWSEKFGQEDVDHMVKICQKSLTHYNYFKRRIPNWYREERKHMEITIVPGTIDDVDELENLYNDLNDALEAGINYAGWKKGVYPIRKDAVDGIKEGNLYIAKYENKIVGSFILNHKPEAAYNTVTWKADVDYDQVLVVHTFVVHPNYLRLGIGKALMNFATQLGMTLQMKAIRLDVYEKNEPAIRLYEKCGYCYIDTVDLGLRDYGLDWFRLYEKLLKDKPY